MFEGSKFHENLLNLHAHHTIQHEIFCRSIYFSAAGEPLIGMSDEFVAATGDTEARTVRASNSFAGRTPPETGHRRKCRQHIDGGGTQMQLAKWVVCVAGATAIVLSGASPAQGQTVTFTDINDAVPGRFYDAATSGPDALDPNRLRIGFESGLDFRTFQYTDFRASSAAFSHPSAMDTISFRVTAPAGYYIARITYSQRGTGSVVRTGRAAGMTNWVVGDHPADVGVFATIPTLSRTVDLTGQNLTQVPVSISNSLFAFSTPLLGSATVAITSADVLVEVLPLATDAGSQ